MEPFGPGTLRATAKDAFGDEPLAREDAAREPRFVVQKHRARRLHYDLRLELGGVLKSWAVPKGPSFDPAVKRMAVLVEDHPIEYAEFEGVIPEGNYGAGAVIVWDRGTWRALEDPDVGLAKGKLLFELAGYKLRGVWTLVRTKGDGRGKAWLLIKKPDGYAAEEGMKSLDPASILSGLTVEELSEGRDRSQDLRARLDDLGAPMKKVRAIDQRPMLAETAEGPFTRAGWLFELKYDGYRLIAEMDGTEVRLFYRRGGDATRIFPDLARALGKLPFHRFILDGEVVVLGDNARPSFQRLQKRVQLTRDADIERAAFEHPSTFYAFDLLSFEGYDLRALPLRSRKEILGAMLPKSGPLRYSDHIDELGTALYGEVQKMGLEGIMAKRAESPYRAGRSADWLKIRVDRTEDFAIVGYTIPKGQRQGFGALHLGVVEGGRLVYAGRAGSGFDEKQLREIRARLDQRKRVTPATEGAHPAGSEHVWVEPELVCEIRYKETTEEGLLRQPVFLRLRDDKRAEDCVRQTFPRRNGDTKASRPSPPPAAARTPAAEPRPKAETKTEAATKKATTARTAAPGKKTDVTGRRTIPFTNLSKTFWPEEGYTKGDLIEYYRSISPWLLPYLRDRPVVLTRYPDGIDGKSFFQKDAPAFVPGWVRTERMWSEHASRDIDYFICDDEETLLYVINLGSIPLHVWSSRMRTLQQPDWCILDLDPKGAPFEHVVEIARAIRALAEDIELDCFIKTSGSTGLHVLIPLGGQCTYEQSRSFGELLSRVIVVELPEIATTARALGARRGRVYLDYLQNGHGRLLVSPLSVRPLAHAPVSMPLRWSEVSAKLDPKRFTIATAAARLSKMRADPLAPVLSVRPDLQRTLERLAERVERASSSSPRPRG